MDRTLIITKGIIPLNCIRCFSSFLCTLSDHSINLYQKFVKISRRVFQSYDADTISLLKITKGHNSVKINVAIQFFFSAHCLMMVNICTKFRKNILSGLRVLERTQIQYHYKEA